MVSVDEKGAWERQAVQKNGKTGSNRETFWPARGFMGVLHAWVISISGEKMDFWLVFELRGVIRVEVVLNLAQFRDSLT
jgi:hypothetical protein